MDYETAKSVAAFGGLALGLINLGLALYKDYLRKGKLKVVVEKATVRWRGRGDYDYQVNVALSATGGDVYLKEVRLFNPERLYHLWGDKLEIPARIACALTHEELPELDEKIFEKRVRELLAVPIAIRDLCLKSGETKSLTLPQRYVSLRLPDQWAEFPLNDWTIEIEHSNGHQAVEFSFKNIRDEDKGAFIR